MAREKTAIFKPRKVKKLSRTLTGTSDSSYEKSQGIDFGKIAHFEDASFQVRQSLPAKRSAEFDGSQLSASPLFPGVSSSAQFIDLTPFV